MYAEEDNWNLVEGANITVSNDSEGNFLATTNITHFSSFSFLWSKPVKYFMNLFARSFRGRCQVFMSREIKYQSSLNFAIAVLLYPFQKPYDTLSNYHYMLYDSVLPIKFTAGNLQCKIELDDSLLQKSDGCKSQRCYSQCLKFSNGCSARADFSFKLKMGTDVISKLPAGIVLADLFIDHNHGSFPKIALIKVNCVL